MHALTTLLFASAASARIVGLAAPAIIAPNDNITLTLITENYIQTVKDLSTAFALTQQVYGDGYIGVDFLGEFYLGPDKSNVLGNLNFTVTTPADISSIKYVTGIVNSLYGASNGAVTYEFAVPVTPGTTTSEEYNRNTQWLDGNCFANPTENLKPRQSCFPTSTQSSIQTSLINAQNLINSIVQHNNATGQQNLGELNGSYGDVFRAIDLQSQGVSACNIPNPGPWPPLSASDSEIRATDILRSLQDVLNALSGAVLECDETTAFGLGCEGEQLVGYLQTYYSWGGRGGGGGREQGQCE